MTATETVRALESRLITEAEAVEQALCPSVDALYEAASRESRARVAAPRAVSGAGGSR